MTWGSGARRRKPASRGSFCPFSFDIMEFFGRAIACCMMMRGCTGAYPIAVPASGALRHMLSLIIYMLFISPIECVCPYCKGTIVACNGAGDDCPLVVKAATQPCCYSCWSALRRLFSFSIFMLCVLPIDCVCIHCKDSIPGCRGGDACPLVTTVASNTAVMARGANGVVCALQGD